jgi:peptide-methionine (R)-S-oxide reductase
MARIEKTDEEWRKELTAQEYEVLRGKGTEPAGSGEYDKMKPVSGHFVCRGCGNPLYSAAAKFASGCGWPAFDMCFKDAVKTNVDDSFGMRRVEIVCARCDGHLGHVFEGEGFGKRGESRSDERHCVNSISVKFVKDAVAELNEEAVTEKLK